MSNETISHDDDMSKLHPMRIEDAVDAHEDVVARLGSAALQLAEALGSIRSGDADDAEELVIGALRALGEASGCAYTLKTFIADTARAHDVGVGETGRNTLYIVRG